MEGEREGDVTEVGMQSFAPSVVITKSAAVEPVEQPEKKVDPRLIPLENLLGREVALIGYEGNPDISIANNLALITALLDRILTKMDTLRPFR